MKYEGETIYLLAKSIQQLNSNTVDAIIVSGIVEKLFENNKPTCTYVFLAFKYAVNNTKPNRFLKIQYKII